MRRVAEIALFTPDPDQLIAFYERLLETAPESRWPGGAIFALGDVKLLVHVSAPSAPGQPDNVDHVAFAVEDVDAAAEALRGQGVEVDGPRDFDWGRSAYLRDPDGRYVEIG